MKLTSAAAIFVLGIATVAAAQTPPGAPPDPVHMSRQALQAEVQASRAMVQNGGVDAQRPSGCTDAEHRQFDFWLGEWDIAPTGNAMVVGEATISSRDQGCVMLEEFRPFQGGHGTGLFGYDSVRHKWRQSFLDSNGTYATAEGEFQNNIMSFLITEPPPPSRFPPDMPRRINFQRIDSNTVRQWGERLDPSTHSWVQFLDLTYHRRGVVN